MQVSLKTEIDHLYWQEKVLILKSITKKNSRLFGDERRRQLPKKGPKLVTQEFQQRTQYISEDIKSVSDTIKLLKLETEVCKWRKAP